MSSDPKTCPDAPSLDQKFEKISDALNASGANQKCKSSFNNAVNTSLSKVDAAAAAFALPFGGGGATTSYTDAQNHLRESLTKEGCSDFFTNINQQISSEQSILCTVSNKKSTTSLSGSANASVKIIQMPPTKDQIDLREKALKLISPPIAPPFTLSPDVYKLANKNYKAQQKIVKDEIDSIMGKISFTGSSFTIKSNIDMKVVSNTKEIDVTQVATQFKNVATAKALSDIKDKTGLGADSSPLKSLVSQKISQKNQTITDSIKNSLQAIKVSGTTGSDFVLKFYGPLTLKNVTLDEFAQGRLITQNIITSASNLGSSVANEIMSDAQTGNHGDKESDGEAALMKQLLAAEVALSKENADGAANLFGKITGFFSSIIGKITGFLSMFGMIPLIIGVVVLLFFPQIANIIAPGPLKYVLAAVLFYFILAYFLDFWPFNKSEKSYFPHDVPMYVMTHHEEDKKHQGPYQFSVDHSWRMQ